MRIGIDVGGTNTDAVLLGASNEVLAETKQATTTDVTSGITSAINALQRQHALQPHEVNAVMIGTTHFINALVERERLAPTACIRLGLPATSALPPLVDWPDNLLQAIHAKTYMAHGGNEFDGSKIANIDADEIRRIADDIQASGIKSIAIAAVFSPVNASFENEVAELLTAQLDADVAISLSHEIGQIGLLERENAAVINASLRDMSERVTGALLRSVREAGFTAPVYLSQNDGTLMDLDYARRYPVSTFASGPTNSMRGAAVLSGLENCAVIDIGGTTSDIGVLTSGFPRVATTAVEVAGIRTNFRMPDVLSVGIGGGSLIGDAGLTVGPRSVGYELTKRALVFGGGELTATDIAVAAGHSNVGDPSQVQTLDRSIVRRALERITTDIERVVDRMRTTRDPLPIVAVGGGSILLPEVLPHYGKIYKPEHFAVANAIGAAISQISGSTDKIYSLTTGSRSAAIDEAKQEATDKAVAAGAHPSTVKIIEFDEVPIPYLPGNATRIKVKAVGELMVKD